MKAVLKRADIEKLIGPCGLEGATLEADHPDGIDLSTQAGKDAADSFFAKGYEAEYGLAVVLDHTERQTFIEHTIDLRKELLGVTTQEELAEVVNEVDEARREVAIGIMRDIGSNARPTDLVLAVKRVKEAALKLQDADAVETFKGRMNDWYQTEVALLA